MVRSALTPVAALLIGVSLLLTGQGLQGTLLPVRATLENFSPMSIGVIGAFYFLGFTLGCLKGGDLVARVGHVRVFAAMTGLASATPLLHGLVLDPVIWTGLRMLTGFCFAVLYIVIESWLNDVSTNENRGMVFSTYVMITMSVFAIGQMLLLVQDPSQLYLFALTSVLISIAVMPVVLSTSPGPQQPHSTRLNMRRLFNISPAGTVACMASGLANGAFWALAPAFIIAMYGDVSLASWFMTANVLGGAVSQWPIGSLSDRVGRRPMLIACALGSGAVAASIAVYGSSMESNTLIVLGFAWGAFAFPQYAIAVANANDHADPSEYVMVSSGLLLMYGLGAIAGPFLASSLMAAFGSPALYMHTSVVHVLVAGYIAFRATRRGKVADEDQLDFSESLVAAHTKSQVYEEESQVEATEPKPAA